MQDYKDRTGDVGLIFTQETQCQPEIYAKMLQNVVKDLKICNCHFCLFLKHLLKTPIDISKFKETMGDHSNVFLLPTTVFSSINNNFTSLVILSM